MSTSVTYMHFSWISKYTTRRPGSHTHGTYFMPIYCWWLLSVLHSVIWKHHFWKWLVENQEVANFAIRLDIHPHFSLDQCTHGLSGDNYLDIHAWQDACKRQCRWLLRNICGGERRKVREKYGHVEGSWRHWLESCMTRPLEQDQQCHIPISCKSCNKTVTKITF